MADKSAVRISHGRRMHTRLLVVAASACAILALTSCAQEPVDRSFDPHLSLAMSRMVQVGGPDGWVTRTASLALVDPSQPGEALVLTRQGITAQFRLGDATFFAVTGWDSGEFDRRNPVQVAAVCQMFTGWLVQGARNILSPAAELQDYWPEECAQVVGDPKATIGETVWFTEPSILQVQEAWFLGGLVKVDGDTAQVTAVLGVKKFPYAADLPDPEPSTGRPAPSGSRSASPTASR